MANPNAKRKRILTQELIDAAIPTEREKTFAKLYFESDRSAFEAFKKLRALEGKNLNTTDGFLRKSAVLFHKKPGVRKLLAIHENQIMKVTEKQLSKYAISKERVIEELVKIAFTNVTDTAEWDEEGVRTKNSADIPEDARAAILDVTEYETKQGRKIKIKNIDKTKALELLGKNLGLFVDKHQHEHKLLSVNFVIEK